MRHEASQRRFLLPNRRRATAEPRQVLQGGIVKAWHFLQEDGRCGHGRLGVIEVGKTYSFNGDIKLCGRGLHASVRLIDALIYAPGPLLCRVEMGGEIVKGYDKVVASKRTVLWMQDISELLYRFACDEAERVLKRSNVTDERCWGAIRAKRKWLKGEITDQELAAARDAAIYAAWDAARAAARVAAIYTARDAAIYTARAAARVAARAAARVAARDAAIYTARDAARDAARVAERKAQNRRLTARVKRLMEIK